MMAVPMIPMFTIKLDTMPYDKLRMMEAWGHWNIPNWQQRRWIGQLWGSVALRELEAFFED